jgi:methyl-accepting chemotaxis protein
MKQSSLDEAQAARQTYADARSLILLFSVVSVLSGVAAAVFISRGLLRQLGGEPHYAASVVNAIAAGDPATPVTLRPDDRSSVLYAMDAMRASVADIVARVRSGTDAIASASSQVAAGSLDLSTRTEQQASSLEETASSMEELTSTVAQNAANAIQAKGLASAASEIASKGGQVVDTIGEIEASSKQIVDIIGVIDGSAFQTNILALNAQRSGRGRQCRRTGQRLRGGGRGSTQSGAARRRRGDGRCDAAKRSAGGAGCRRGAIDVRPGVHAGPAGQCIQAGRRGSAGCDDAAPDPGGA